MRQLLLTVSVLSIDALTASHYAEIRMVLKTAGRPIPVNDLWIAAIAKQHGMPLVPRDTHFDHVPGISAVAW